MVVRAANNGVELLLNAVKAVRVVFVESAVLLENRAVPIELLVDVGKSPVDVLEPSVDVFEAPRDHLRQLLEGDAPSRGGAVINATGGPVKDERLREQKRERRRIVGAALAHEVHSVYFWHRPAG